MINVVNKYKHQPTDNDVYIGRGSPLGNPFTGSKKLEDTKAEFQCASREEAIESYEDYLRLAISNKNNYICQELNKIHKMAKLGDVNLVCFCKPKDCHGDVIKRIIEEKL